MLDVLIGRPLGEILKGINLSRDVKGALLGIQGEYRQLLNVVISYERGDWERCSRYVSALHLNPDRIPSIFLRAVEWADKITKVGDQLKDCDAQMPQTERL